MINLIVATDRNGCIGNKGRIPWQIPNDLKYFKEVTNNSSVIMGRKTFESIGKALPNRINIVVSKKTVFKCDVISVTSIDDALFKCPFDKKIFVIGGSEIYHQFISRKLVDRIYLTEIDCQTDGDAFFKLPEGWKLESSKVVEPDEKNCFKQTYKVYRRY